MGEDHGGKIECDSENIIGKYVLKERSTNEYSQLRNSAVIQELNFPTDKDALRELEALRADSGTGPDASPARVLKECARQLAKPITILIHRILGLLVWPDSWREHWIVPLYKKRGGLPM